MKDKTEVKVGNMIVKISEFDKQRKWLSVHTTDGGTNSRPYGIIELKELVELKSLVQRAINELKVKV